VDLYAIVKTVHIVSAAILFGTGLGIAFFFWSAQRRGDLAARYFTARITVLADFVFTLPAVMIQPISGAWLIAETGFDWRAPWLVASYAFYLLAGACWLPVLWIQRDLRSMLQDAAERNIPLPPRFQRRFRLWFILGWPAFLGLVAVFFLMVAKPS